MNDVFNGIMGFALILASAVILGGMMYTAVLMDCRNPPKRSSMAADMAMFWICPDRR